jgi:hypothetical protein
VDFSDFDREYTILLDKFESQKSARKAPRSFEESKKYQSTLKGSNTAPPGKKLDGPRPYQPKDAKEKPSKQG